MKKGRYKTNTVLSPCAWLNIDRNAHMSHIKNLHTCHTLGSEKNHQIGGKTIHD